MRRVIAGHLSRPARILVPLAESLSFDLIVVGAGPGGYVAAIRASQLGLKVAIIDKRPTLGGTCLNVGCIPSKALLHSSERYFEAKRHFPDMGIKVGALDIDLGLRMASKDSVVEASVKGVSYLMKKNGIETFVGVGRVEGPGKVSVSGSDGEVLLLEATSVLLATGSESMTIPGVTADEKKIVTSTGALTFSSVPKKLVVIGAGVIGMELGAVWSRLGSEVTVVDVLDEILPGFDGEVRKAFRRIARKDGMAFSLGQKVESLVRKGRGVEVVLSKVSGDDRTTLRADAALVAIGRKPFSEGLGLEELGVARDERGFVLVDDRFATSVPSIYAIGDLVPGPMLAHKAEDEGMAFAEGVSGRGTVPLGAIPSVVYVSPEIASIGDSEESLKAQGRSYRSGSFPLSASGRARAMNVHAGFVKILADAQTDEVLGAHMIAPGAGELIQEVATVMAFRGSAEDIARTCHAHPTLAEAVREAALAVDGRALHI